MLINPYLTTQLPVIQGTRMLQEDFGLVGFSVEDPATIDRVWTVRSIYAPIAGRRLGGLRVKLDDQKGFVTFCNQRDFEVLLGLGRPGGWCQWAAEEYPAPGDENWYGFCMDSLDLKDDLYERELELLAMFNAGQVNWSLAEITRRIHMSKTSDAEDLWIPDLGQQVRVLDRETLYTRWLRVSRDRVEWKRLP